MATDDDTVIDLPVVLRDVGGETTPTVSARALHRALQIKKDFSRWFSATQRARSLVDDVEFVATTAPDGAPFDYALRLVIARNLIASSTQARSQDGEAYDQSEPMPNMAPTSTNRPKRQLPPRPAVIVRHQPVTLAIWFRKRCDEREAIRTPAEEERLSGIGFKSVDKLRLDGRPPVNPSIRKR